MQNKLKEASVELKEVCDRCGKPISRGALGSLTGWIFGRAQCTCSINLSPQIQSGNQPTTPASATHSPQALPIDEASKLGLDKQYEILEKLGQGGMGAVYKVRELATNKIFAIKVLNQSLCTDARNVERFEREVETSMSLSHPNLVSVYKQGITSSGSPFLLMDFLDGEDLSKYLAHTGCISQERAIDLFYQICEAFNHAHAKGIVHRDIKPGNIIITKTEGGNDYVKIVDFGIAKILPIGGEAIKQFTQTDELIGSPFYMSPEQCRGEELDARSDIYSLGCVMYEALSGKPPFPGTNPVKIILSHLNNRPEAFDRFLSIGSDLENIIMTCLEKDPAKRYQSVYEIMIDLDRIRSGQKPLRLITSQKQAIAKHIKKGLLLAFTGACLSLTWVISDNMLHFTNPWINEIPKAKALEELGRGHYSEAEQILKQAFATAEAHHADNSEKAQILDELGELYFRWPHTKKAINTFTQALALTEKTADGETPWRIATFCDYLCALNNNPDHKEEAKVYGEKALALRRALHAPRLVVNVLVHLCETYLLLKDYDKAEAYAKEAIAIETQLHAAKDDPILGFANYRLARSILQRDNPTPEQLDVAADAGHKAIAVWLNDSGPNDITTNAAKWLAIRLERFNKDDAAAKIMNEIRVADKDQ